MNHPKFTDAQLQKILEEEYDFKFGLPFHKEVPYPNEAYINHDNLNLQRLISFLVEAVIIEDPFSKEDHQSRRDHRNKFERQYNCNDFFRRKSKLRGGNLVVLVNLPEFIIYDVKKRDRDIYTILTEREDNSPVFNEELRNQLVLYNKLDLKEKIALVTKMDEAAYQFLVDFPK